MGGRGGSGTRNTVKSVQSFTERVDSFIEDLENRNYGSSKKLVPEKQQNEYRALKREINLYFDAWGTDDGKLLVFAGGFAKGKAAETYIHTTAKLNQYQRLVRSDANRLKMDLSLGVITEQQAERELLVIRSIDATIKDRRELENYVRRY